MQDLLQDISLKVKDNGWDYRSQNGTNASVTVPSQKDTAEVASQLILRRLLLRGLRRVRGQMGTAELLLRVSGKGTANPTEIFHGCPQTLWEMHG
jgi:hypothetical protein